MLKTQPLRHKDDEYNSSDLRMFLDKGREQRQPHELQWKLQAHLATHLNTIDGGYDSWIGGGGAAGRSGNIGVNSHFQYSSDPAIALDKFVATFQTLLMPTASPMFKFMPTDRAVAQLVSNERNDRADDDASVVRRAENAGASVSQMATDAHDSLVSGLSRFDEKFQEVLMEADWHNAFYQSLYSQMALGHGIIGIYGGGNRALEIEGVNPANMWFLSNKSNGFQMSFRLYSVDWMTAKENWGDEIHEPESVARSEGSSWKLREFEIYECVVNRKKTTQSDEGFERYLFLDGHFRKGGGRQEDRKVSSEILSDHMPVVSMDYCPYLLSRWKPMYDTCYGLSVYIHCISNLVYMNKILSQQFRIADFASNAMMGVDSEQFLNPEGFDATPGALVPMNMDSRSGGGHPPIVPIDLIGNTGVAAYKALSEQFERIDRSVREAAHSDLTLSTDEKTPSPYEIVARQSEAITKIGPAVVRGNFQSMKKVAGTVLKILPAIKESVDLLTDGDEEGERIVEYLGDKMFVRVDLASPIKRIGQQHQALRRLEFLRGEQELLGGSGIALNDVYDLGAIAREDGLVFDIRADNIRTEEETQALQNDRQQQQQQAMQAEAKAKAEAQGQGEVEA